MPYRWILFDADGTLFDFDGAQEAALRECWSAAGHPGRDGLVTLFRKINGALWRLYESGGTSQERLRVERFERLLQATGTDGDAARLADSFVVRLARHGTLYDGAAALLDALAQRHTLALVTNGIPEVQRARVALSGVGGLFASIVISGEIGVAKPDEGFFAAVFESLGDPPRSEVLIVGDSLSSDIEGGRRAGIATCWLNRTGRAPDPGAPAPTHELRTLEDLPALLAGADGHST